MQQKKTYKMVGLFVIIGLACFAGIIFHYMGKKFSVNNRNLVVMYFEESLSGLSVGSPVVLQGVEIGKVEKIRLITNLQNGTFRTPVYVLFDKKKTRPHRVVHESGKTVLENLINKGLRARLANGNYLTGQLMIELVMEPQEPAVMRGNGKFMEIPTILSPFAMLSNDLKEVPLAESLSRLGDVILDLDQNMPAILANVSQITEKMDRILDKKNGEISKVMLNLNATLEEIAKASRSIKNLTDYLERHPEALLRGKED